MKTDANLKGKRINRSSEKKESTQNDLGTKWSHKIKSSL